MKSVVRRVIDSRGNPRAVTTYTISNADQGTTVATNRSLTGLRYMRPPTAPNGPAILELVDDGVANAVPKAIYRLDLNQQMFAYPQAYGAIEQRLIADQSISFVRLTAARVPAGCTIECDIS
jgi:hypothetical protein